MALDGPRTIKGTMPAWWRVKAHPRHPDSPEYPAGRERDRSEPGPVRRRRVLYPTSAERRSEPAVADASRPTEQRRPMAVSYFKMVDMELTDEEKLDAQMPIPMADRPDYPWGLRITLTDRELSKLNLDDDPDVGDMIHVKAMGRVTSVSSTDGNGRKECRIEIQLEALGVENESEEDEDDEDEE